MALEKKHWMIIGSLAIVTIGSLAYWKREMIKGWFKKSDTPVDTKPNTIVSNTVLKTETLPSGLKVTTNPVTKATTVMTSSGATKISPNDTGAINLLANQKLTNLNAMVPNYKKCSGMACSGIGTAMAKLKSDIKSFGYTLTEKADGTYTMTK